MNDQIRRLGGRLYDILRRHQLVVFIASALVLSAVLVWVALTLYSTSGSLQLDLSRPGYENVRQDIARPENDTYSSSGTLDEESVEEFLRMYDKRLEDITSIDAFGGEVMSDESLGLDYSPPAAN